MQLAVNYKKLFVSESRETKGVMRDLRKIFRVSLALRLDLKTLAVRDNKELKTVKGLNPGVVSWVD